MVGRELNTDDGPKLREEGNYQDFYPTLTKEDRLPLFINGHNNNVDDIYINADTQSLLYNQGIHVKQLLCNGKITVEPLVIESMESGCHTCKTNISNLNNSIDGEKSNTQEVVNQQSKPAQSSSPFQELTYLTKLDTELDPIANYDRGTINNNQSYRLKEMKNKLSNITPNLKHLHNYYDMDEQDELFLQYLKEQNSDLRLDDLQFELFFTILELEYTLFQSHIPKPPPPPAFTDQVCSICNGQETANNTIVFCDCCNIAVHQDCYGIIFIPPGPWLCRVCLQNSMLSQRPRCIVCPETDGPMKQTTSGNWIHVTCAVWIRELNFGNWHYLEPIEGVERIPNLRWKLNCFICKQKTGACIQCSNKNCFTAYHVSCARRLGLTMTPLRTGSLAEMALGNDNELESFCDKHSHPIARTYNSFDAEIQQLRDEIERGNETHRGNLQNEIVIPPHIFADYILQSIIELDVLTDEKKAQELSFTICKYWSLKKEYNRGEPLLNISDNIFQYCYNLLEENDIRNKISFIDVILKDLTKIEKLTTMVCNRYEKENELRDTNKRIRKLLSSTTYSIIKQIFLEKFLKASAFDVVSRYLRDNDFDYSFVDKLTEFKFKDTSEFEITVNNFFLYLKSLNVISRIVSSSIDKLEAVYNKIIESVSEVDIHKLLNQDFIIDDDDVTHIVERSWHGKMLMREEELSDVEDLTIPELKAVNNIFEPIYVETDNSSDRMNRVGRRTRTYKVSKARYTSGPQLGKRQEKNSTVNVTSSTPPVIYNKDGSIRKKPGPKLKRRTKKVLAKVPSNPRVYNKDGSIRKKPGRKVQKRVEETSYEVLDPTPIQSKERSFRSKPNKRVQPPVEEIPHGTLASPVLIYNKDGSIRKKPGPKMKRKAGSKKKQKPKPSPKPRVSRPVILNKDGTVRKKPGPKNRRRRARW